MRKKHFTKIITAALLTLTLAFTGCGAGDSEKGSTSSDGKELTTVRLGVMTGYNDSWLATVGKAKGIYEKYGLDVQTTEFAAGINTVDAITTDQIDIGFTADFAGVNRIGNTQDKGNLRYFAGISSSDASELYVNPETIKTEADIKGKTILTLLGTVWEYMNATAVQHAGYTNDDVEYKAVDSMQDGLAVANAGDADAVFTSGENAVRLEQYGWTPLLGQGDIGITTYCLYMANQEYLEDNNETVVNFIKATQEIIDFMNENVDEAADILYDKVGLEQDVFKNQVAAIEYKLDVTQDTYDTLQKVADWTQQNGYYDTPYSIADYLNTDALAEAFPDKVSFTAK